MRSINQHSPLVNKAPCLPHHTSETGSLFPPFHYCLPHGEEKDGQEFHLHSQRQSLHFHSIPISPAPRVHPPRLHPPRHHPQPLKSSLRIHNPRRLLRRIQRLPPSTSYLHQRPHPPTSPHTQRHGGPQMSLHLTQHHTPWTPHSKRPPHFSPFL